MAPTKGWKKALLLYFRHLVLIQLYPSTASSALSVYRPVHNADTPDSANFRNADISYSGHDHSPQNPRAGSSILSHQSMGPFPSPQGHDCIQHPSLHTTRACVTSGEAEWKQGTGLCHSKTKTAIPTLTLRNGHFCLLTSYRGRNRSLPIIHD